jgi:DNA invertase Pin-like site-specific DNA recombinase
MAGLSLTKRALRHLIDTITELGDRGVGFKSLQENIDTTTSGGKLVFHIFGALAEFEREIIKERTQAGHASARSRGQVGGRPKALSARQVQILRNMAADKSLTVSDICKTLRFWNRFAPLWTTTLRAVLECFSKAVPKSKCQNPVPIGVFWHRGERSAPGTALSG